MSTFATAFTGMWMFAERNRFYKAFDQSEAIIQLLFPWRGQPSFSSLCPLTPRSLEVSAMLPVWLDSGHCPFALLRPFLTGFKLPCGSLSCLTFCLNTCRGQVWFFGIQQLLGLMCKMLVIALCFLGNRMHSSGVMLTCRSDYSLWAFPSG